MIELKKFLKEASIECPNELSPDQLLRDSSWWDSMARLFFMATAESECGIVITSDDLLNFEVVADLANALNMSVDDSN